MGFEYQKRPERRREDEPILPARGQTRRMSAKAAAKLIHAAKKSGAEVRQEIGNGLEKPTSGKQMKSCPLCDHTAGPSASHACPMCGQQASSGLEKPVDSVQMKGAGTADAAERQADTLGAKIGAELSGMSVGAGTLSPSAASVAERHVGTSVAGAELRSDASANAHASSMGALAVTEGDRVSFAAGRLDGSTSAGRGLVGHELVHVAQQRAHGMSARQGFLGLGGDDGEEGGGSSGGGVMTGIGLAGPGGRGGEGSLRSGPAATEAPGGGETVFGGTIRLPDGAEEYGVHGQGTVEVRVNENGSITVEFAGGAGVRIGANEYGFGGSGAVTVSHPSGGQEFVCLDGTLVSDPSDCKGGLPPPPPEPNQRISKCQSALFVVSGTQPVAGAEPLVSLCDWAVTKKYPGPPTGSAGLGVAIVFEPANWKYDAAVKVSLLGRPHRDIGWLIGYIQTMRYGQYWTRYESGLEVTSEVEEANDSIDFQPWYRQPLRLKTPLAGSAEMDDMPRGSAIQWSKCKPAEFRQIGVFDTWLALENDVDGHILFVGRRRVVYDVGYMLPTGFNPFETESWIPTGVKFEISDPQPGVGPADPVLWGTPVNRQLKDTPPRRSGTCPADSA